MLLLRKQFLRNLKPILRVVRLICIIFTLYTFYYFAGDLHNFTVSTISRRFAPVQLICDELTATNVSLFRDTILTPDNPWLTVADRNFVGYSAYYDLKRDPQTFRILGLRYVHYALPAVCVVFSSADNRTWEISARPVTYELINEMLECIVLRLCAYNPHDAFYANCPLGDDRLLADSRDGTKFPFPYNYVSVLAPENFVQSCPNLLQNLPKIPVKFVPLVENDDKNMVVCISPTFDWNDVILLQLFLEHYLSQGVDKFVVYKRSWTRKINKLLNRYSRHIEIVDWPALPPVPFVADLNDGHSVHYNGQVLAMNDCVWRQKYTARFVVSVDIDEFMTPLNSDNTLFDMINRLDSPDIDGFMIRNRYVTFETKNLTENTPIAMDSYVFPLEIRTKMIVKPERVDKHGIHNVWKYRKHLESAQLNIPPQAAIIYHWKPVGHEGFSGRFLPDKPVFAQIFPRLIDRWRQIRQTPLSVND